MFGTAFVSGFPGALFVSGFPGALGKPISGHLSACDASAANTKWMHIRSRKGPLKLDPCLRAES